MKSKSGRRRQPSGWRTIFNPDQTAGVSDATRRALLETRRSILKKLSIRLQSKVAFLREVNTGPATRMLTGPNRA